MSAAMIPIAVEALTELIPLVKDMFDQAKASENPPTAEQEAAMDAALDKADAAIQAA